MPRKLVGLVWRLPQWGHLSGVEKAVAFHSISAPSNLCPHLSQTKVVNPLSIVFPVYMVNAFNAKAMEDSWRRTVALSPPVLSSRPLSFSSADVVVSTSLIPLFSLKPLLTIAWFSFSLFMSIVFLSNECKVNSRLCQLSTQARAFSTFLFGQSFRRDASA